MNFSKKDFLVSFSAGVVIAFLSLPIFKNIGLFAVFAEHKIIFLFFWTLFLSISAALGLFIVYYFTIAKWPLLFQIGKYGIVGFLNLFLSAGIFNFLIFLSGVSKGFMVDFFFISAFCVGVTNSFFWNKFWTFGLGDKNGMQKEYLRFFLVSAAVAFFNALILHVLINVISAPKSVDPKIWANISFALLIPVSFLGNFIGYKIFVFRKISFCHKK